jgi:hypothetical protein
MDTGSADHTARNGEPVHMSRSGSTRPFAPDSPMAKKLKKKEQEMLTNWPTADEDPTEEIPPTEPRPTQLNFESANIANIANIANKPIAFAQANDAPAPTDNAPAPALHTMPSPQSKAAASATNNAHKTPSYLQTATTNNALSLDTIISTVLGTYECPATLLNPNKHVKAFCDVLADYSKRFPESHRVISPHSSSETWRNEFNQYYSEFRSRNQWLDEPATVALLTKIADLSSAARLIVQKAWMHSVGLSDIESYDLAARIKDTGEMGDRQATHEDLLHINFDGLAAVTTEALCNTGSNSDATDQTLTNLATMDVNECRNLPQLLAMELALWQACYRELDGPPMATYLRLNNLKAACGRDAIWCELNTAFNDITSRDKKIKISKVKTWSTVEAKLHEAWDLVCNQGLLQRFDSLVDGRSEMGDSLDGLVDGSSSGLSAHHSFLPKRNNEGTFEDKTTSDLKDQKLTCKDCKKEFTDSIDDQAHRARKGWNQRPARCPPCKVIYLAKLAKDPQPCSDFKSGSCSFGDRCRYLHVEDKTPAAHCAEYLSSSDSDSDSIDLECY